MPPVDAEAEVPLLGCWVEVGRSQGSVPMDPPPQLGGLTRHSLQMWACRWACAELFSKVQTQQACLLLPAYSRGFPSAFRRLKASWNVLVLWRKTRHWWEACLVCEWDHDYDVHLHVTSMEYTQLGAVWRWVGLEKKENSSREGGGRVKVC